MITMKKYFLAIVAFCSCFSVLAQTKPNQPAKKMNIVFFLVDDLGYMDVGYNGSSFYETPHLDSFAKKSARFNNAYAACHVCSPSRAAIMTGKSPARLNMTDWLPGRKNFPFQMLSNVVVNQQLPYGEKTIAEALKENGYRTAIFGKWHLGEDPSNPEAHGFDLHLPNWSKGWPNETYFAPYNMKGLEDAPKGEYLTDRLTDEALKYMEANKDQPFFLYLSHFAVHDPIQGRPDLVKKYQEKLAKMPKQSGEPFILEGNPDTSKPFTRAELDAMLNNTSYKGYAMFPNRTVKIKQFQDNVQFAAMVESMDESFGRVIAKLKELGIEDNTIVIYFSDNGGMSGGNFGNPTRTIPEKNLDKAFSTSNLPLRGAKGWFYEGGIKEPLLISWPGKTRSGETIDAPVIGMDMYPTILEMLGMPLNPAQHKDGLSLVPLLEEKTKKSPHEALYWHFPHYSNHGGQSPGGAIRYGKYKLLEYYEHNTVQLFDLEKDPGELNDISKTETAVTKKLTKMLHDWRKQSGAHENEPNPDYNKPMKLDVNDHGTH